VAKKNKTESEITLYIWGGVVVLALILCVALFSGGNEGGVSGDISADIAPFNHDSALSEAIAYIYVYHDLPISKPTSNPGDWQEQTISSSIIRFTQGGWVADVDETGVGAFDFIITYTSASYSMEWVGYRSISGGLSAAVTTWTGLPPPTSVQPTTTGTYIPSSIYETSFTETYHNGVTTVITTDGGTTTTPDSGDNTLLLVLIFITGLVGGMTIIILSRKS